MFEMIEKMDSRAASQIKAVITRERDWIDRYKEYGSHKWHVKVTGKVGTDSNGQTFYEVTDKRNKQEYRVTRTTRKGQNRTIIEEVG